MIENTNTKQFYPGPILNNTLEITDFLFNDAEQIKIKHSKLNEEDILVDVDLNYPTDYEVTKVLPSDINAAEAALTASTGQIMLKNVNVLAGEKLTVYRVSQIIQDKDYPRTGAFPAATHEGALDYLTMQNQEQKDEIDRALKVPVSTQNFEGSLPLPIPSRALKINNDGTGFEMSEFDPDLALVTTEEFKNQAQQAAAEALASQNVATRQATIATTQANLATRQANIATEKTAEVVESGTTAIQNIDTAFSTVNEWFEKLNAIPYIPVGTILPTTGAIDESLGYQRYASGQLIANVSSQAPDLVKFLEFQEVHAPNLLCSETEWQTALTLSTLGQVGKYVWNKEEDSVRIPRIVNIQGMLDMNTVGNMVEAGLPNITGTMNNNIACFNAYPVTTDGAFEGTNAPSAFLTRTGSGNGEVIGLNNLAFDASNSNAIYGNSNTVQEESILYPYVLQIATGVQYKTPVINEIELNNPFFYGLSQYFESEPNNISWLKSNGQWNSKAIYTDYYDWILTNVNAGVRGFLNSRMYAYTPTGTGIIYTLPNTNPVVGMACYGWSDGSYVNTPLSTITQVNEDGTFVANFNGSDYTFERNESRDQSVVFPSDYDYVINQAEETFRLPLLDGSEDLVSDRYIDLTLGASGDTYTASANGYFVLHQLASSGQSFVRIKLRTNDFTNITAQDRYNAVSSNPLFAYLPVKKGQTVIIDYSASNSTAFFRFVYAQGNGSLYYYVGETVQNANLINAGRIEEKLTDKVDTNASNFTAEGKSLISGYAMPSDKYINLTLGAHGTVYTAPANGWFRLVKWTTAVGQNIQFNPHELYRGWDNSDAWMYQYSSIANQLLTITLPVLKGQKTWCYYTAGGETVVFEFIYAEGEN